MLMVYCPVKKRKLTANYRVINKIHTFAYFFLLLFSNKSRALEVNAYIIHVCIYIRIYTTYKH